MSADTEMKTIPTADENTLYQLVCDACGTKSRDHNDVLDAVNRYIDLMGRIGGVVTHRWLRMCTDARKFDVICSACRPQATDVNSWLNEFPGSVPFLHYLVYWDQYDLARHYVKVYKPDVSLIDTMSGTIVEALSGCATYTRGAEACALLEWMIVNTDIEVEEPMNTYGLHEAAALAIERGLEVRRDRTAMQVFVQGDTTRTKCRGAVNRSLFRHRLFDKNVVGMIAEYMYKNDDSPP